MSCVITHSLNAFTVKNLRQILKKHGYSEKTYNMRKHELIHHTKMMMLKYMNKDFIDELQIDKSIIIKSQVFNTLRKRKNLTKNLYIYFLNKNKMLLKRAFSVLAKSVRLNKLECMVESELEIFNREEITDIIRKEAMEWETDMVFTITPHEDKLKIQSQIFKMIMISEEFSESDCMYLYHGCDKKTLDSILQYGNFSTIMCGRAHGSKYGPGIYLTSKLWKAIQYSERSIHTSHSKYVLVCKVLVKNIEVAKPLQLLHGKNKYGNQIDTSVDNMKDPIEYIKKKPEHICILGYLEISIENRNCKLLNKAFGKLPAILHHKSNMNPGINSTTGIKFTNTFSHVVSIYWIPPVGGSQTLMNGGVPSGASTIIKTMIGHTFEIIYNNNTVLTITIDTNHINNGEVFIR